MTLSAEEFLRRFCLHVLPKGFVRIRFYGFLAPRCRTEALPRCRHALDVESATGPGGLRRRRRRRPCVLAAVSRLRWGDGRRRTTHRTPTRRRRLCIEGLALDSS